MQCKLKSKLDPPKPICTTTTYPPLSPRVVATGERGQPQGVVGGGELAAVGDHNLQWHRGRWAAPLPTTRSAHHHSSSQTAAKPRSDLEGRPLAPASGSLVSSQNGRAGRAAVPFGHFYNPLRCSESSWAVRAGGPSRNPPVCGCPLWPRTAHNGGHGKHEAAAGTTAPPQPTATPPQRGSGEPATTHRSAAAEECALQPPEVEHQQQQQQ